MANRGSIFTPTGGKADHPFWVRYEGPFFDRDPAKQVKANLRDWLQGDVGPPAERAAKAAAPVGTSRRGFPVHATGTLRDAINLRTYGRKPWQTTIVISTWGLGMHRWPGTRGGLPKWGTTWFNYAGKVEARRHFMRKGMRVLRDTRRANAKLLKGLT